MTTTHVIMIMDESGSMAGHEEDVVGGFNKYVKDLASDGNTYKLTATKFHSAFRPIFKDLDPKDVPLLKAGRRSEDPTVFAPEGWTALYDAVGRTLRNVEIPDTDKAIVVIMTDGKENSSKEFDSAKVRAEVERLQTKGNWTFLFIGENMDAWTAASIGASMAMGQSVMTTAVEFRSATMAAVSATTTGYAAGRIAKHAVADTTRMSYDAELAKKDPAPTHADKGTQTHPGGAGRPIPKEDSKEKSDGDTSSTK